MTASTARPSRRSTIGLGADLKRAVTEAHKLLDDLFAADMAALGLTLGEADLLTVAYVADYPPVPSELADWLSLTGAGATGRLNTLERRGLVERRPHPTDGRSVTVHLTAEGETLAAAVIEAKNTAVLNRIIEQLGTTTATRLVTDLDAIIAAARTALDDE